MSNLSIIPHAPLSPQKRRSSTSTSKGLKVVKAMTGDRAVAVLKAAGILTNDGKLSSKFK